MISITKIKSISYELFFLTNPEFTSYKPRVISYKPRVISYKPRVHFLQTPSSLLTNPEL